MTYVEAYLCECGHAMRKYLSGYLGGLDRFTFHNCCPECGRHREKINLVTGYWQQERIVRGIWPFRMVEHRDVKFIPSEFNSSATSGNNGQ